MCDHRWRKRFKRLIIYVLIMASIFGNSFTATTAYADNAADGQRAEFLDIQDHWAREQIINWSDKGLIAGYSDGTFGPERGVTRAEFITFVNRAYGLTEKADVNFSDVSPQDWFADEVAKAVAAGYISGYDDGTVRPAAGISRLEAAVILYKLLRLDNLDDESWLTGFNDAASIAAWGREYVNAVVAEGYLSGYPDGTFKPDRIITRAETVVLLNKAIGTLYNAPGVYGPEEGIETITGNVTVNVSDVTLQNLVIEGDLFLTAGLGDGDFEADGVVVMGRTVISGGGEESVVFNNTSLEDVIVYVVGGKVRVVARGDTEIENILLQSGAHLQEENLTGDGFGDVQVLALKPGESIELDGHFDKVSIETAVELGLTGNTRIKELEVSAEAKGTIINTSKGTIIETLTLNGATKVTGQGTIRTAYVNTDDYSFETDPDKIVLYGGKDDVDRGGGGGGGGEEKPSVTIGTVDDISIQVNGTREISLTTDAVSVTASSSDDTIAQVQVIGKIITVTGISEGTATITITGSRPDYKSKTITFDVEVVAELKLLFTYPKDKQQDFYPKYSYIALEFSEDMKPLDDPEKITLKTKEGERVTIAKVPVGVDYPKCVLLVVYNNLKLNTEYELNIPFNTLESEDGKPYDKEIQIDFKTAHTVLKGRVHSRFELEGLILELIGKEGQETRTITLGDGGYIFLNPAPGSYILRITNACDKQYEKHITVTENSLNIIDMQLDNVISNVLEATFKVLEVTE